MAQSLSGIWKLLRCCTLSLGTLVSILHFLWLESFFHVWKRAPTTRPSPPSCQHSANCWKHREALGLLILPSYFITEVRCVEVFGKGTCAVSAAMGHSLRIWNLISGRVKFVIQATHIEEQPSHHLHVDEKRRTVYSSSDTKVGPFFSLKSAKRTRTIEVTATVMKVIDRKSTLVLATSLSFAT